MESRKNSRPNYSCPIFINQHQLNHIKKEAEVFDELQEKKYNFDLKLQIHEEKILLPYRKNSDPVLSGEKASNDVVIDIPEEYISELKSQTQQVEKYKVLLEL